MRTPTPAQRTAILKNYAELRRKLEAMERLTIEMMRHPDVTAEQLKEAQIMYARSYQGAFDCYRSISGLGWQFGLEKPGMRVR